jgi:Mor family transcriptional regulator
MEKKYRLNCEMIWKIWKKGKLTSEKMWKISKKRKLNSDNIWKIWKKVVVEVVEVVENICKKCNY